MAFPVLKFNSTSGDDVSASGDDGNVLFGGFASTDATGTIVDLSTDNPDLSNVAADGSRCLFFNDSTSNQRNFSKIVGVDNTAKTLTVPASEALQQNVAFASWATGGKRKTLAGSVRLVNNVSNQNSDAMGGWVLEFEDGHAEALTDRTISLFPETDENYGFIVRGESGAAVRPRLRLDTNFNRILTINAYARFTTWRDLDFVYNSTMDQSSNRGLIDILGQQQNFERCRFYSINSGTFYRGINITSTVNSRGDFRNCYFSGGVESALFSARSLRVYQTFFENCVRAIRFQTFDNNGYPSEIRQNIFKNASSHGIDFENAFSKDMFTFEENVFSEIGGDAIRNSTVQTGVISHAPLVQNNIFSGVTGTAVNIVDDYRQLKIRNNLFFNCGTNSSITDERFESNNIIGQDPLFVDPSGNDFGVSVGAGSPAIATGYPDSEIGDGQTSTRSYFDMGAAQAEQGSSPSPSGSGARSRRERL